MRRRDFIVSLGSAAACSLGELRAAQAEPAERRKQVGWVVGMDDNSEARSRLKAFREGLAARGWIEGRNIEIIARFGTADLARNRAVVAELLRLKPDAIVTSNAITISAVMQETRTIPIVFTMQPDPIAQKFAVSLARPGGNVTGFTSVEQSMAGKWLELLTEVAPGLKRAVMLVDPEDPGSAVLAGALALVAPTRGVQSMAANVRDDAGVEQVIAGQANGPLGGLIVPPSAWLSARRTLIVDLAARHQVPTIYAYRHWVANGGLMFYGPDVLDLYRRPAAYVDRILKGAKPADLPIQQPTRFELAVNLKTAKAIGLTIPESFLVRADEVIE